MAIKFQILIIFRIANEVSSLLKLFLNLPWTLINYIIISFYLSLYINLIGDNGYNLLEMDSRFSQMILPSIQVVNNCEVLYVVMFVVIITYLQCFSKTLLILYGFFVCFLCVFFYCNRRLIIGHPIM